jgi:hypothetical protein
MPRQTIDIINDTMDEKAAHTYNLWQKNATDNLFGIFFICLEIATFLYRIRIAAT